MHNPVANGPANPWAIAARRSVTKDDRGRFVVLAEVPRPYRDDLLACIRREMIAIFHERDGDCIYPCDWFAWREGHRFCPF